MLFEEQNIAYNYAENGTISATLSPTNNSRNCIIPETRLQLHYPSHNLPKFVTPTTRFQVNTLFNNVTGTFRAIKKLVKQLRIDFTDQLKIRKTFRDWTEIFEHFDLKDPCHQVILVAGILCGFLLILEFVTCCSSIGGSHWYLRNIAESFYEAIPLQERQERHTRTNPSNRAATFRLEQV